MVCARIWALWFVSVVGANANPGVTVIIHDLAGVDRTTVIEGEGIASRIFQQSGIELRWSQGGASAPETHLVDFAGANPTRSGCDTTAAITDVRVRIVPAAPRGFPSGALGFALPCARYGVTATIFADRVAGGISSIAPASVSVILGHALAHEIGHVLLRSNLHSEAGLMRGTWTRRDWELSTRFLLGFKRDEALQMQRAIVQGSSVRPR